MTIYETWGVGDTGVIAYSMDHSRFETFEVIAVLDQKHVKIRASGEGHDDPHEFFLHEMNESWFVKEANHLPPPPTHLCANCEHGWEEHTKDEDEASTRCHGFACKCEKYGIKL